jgi:hypothetical protein
VLDEERLVQFNRESVPYIALVAVELLEMMELNGLRERRYYRHRVQPGVTDLNISCHLNLVRNINASLNWYRVAWSISN